MNINNKNYEQMKNISLLLLFTSVTFFQAFSQETPLSPVSNFANISLLESGTSTMTWYMMQDSLKIPIGNVETQIQKEKDRIIIITTVDMKQSPLNWIDSTIVESRNFVPIYHSSYNEQRDMVLKFGRKITGYYLDKQSGISTQISEETETPFFDSNFYPQLIKLLPLKENYTTTISIFDYNPKSKTGVITATIRKTEEATLNFNGEIKQVWKVEATDDISNNAAISTYYIDRSTRKILKQEIDLGGRKMLME